MVLREPERQKDSIQWTRPSKQDANIRYKAASLSHPTRLWLWLRLMMERHHG